MRDQVFPSKESPGLSHRDLFAVRAMHGLVTGLATDGTEKQFAKQAKAQGITVSELIADMAYNVADAMIARRERKGSKS